VRHATLIVNPASGRARLLAAQLPAIQMLLTQHGYTSAVAETSSDLHSASRLAAAAASASSLVLACGGDGTVHEVLQALAHTCVTLGVVPLGTANALARNLLLPLDPLAAVARLLTYTPRTIPLGEIATSWQTRLFTVMAGCGPDGALVHALSQPGSQRLKSRFGRTAYYAHAARLFLTRRWPAFQVDFRTVDSTTWHTTHAVALMAARIPDLGGLFSGLTRSADLTHPHLHVQLLHPPAQLSFAAWMLFTRLHLPYPWLTFIQAVELRCTPLSARPVYAQADAEPIGPLPFNLRILPNALTLLMPPAAD
jgi:diacylglycerol kinase family enzyme